MVRDKAGRVGKGGSLVMEGLRSRFKEVQLAIPQIAHF